MQVYKYISLYFEFYLLCCLIDRFIISKHVPELI